MELAIALREYKEGRFIGPFNAAEQAIKALRSESTTMSKRISDAEENTILAKLETVDPDILDDALAEVSDALDDPDSEPKEQIVEIANALARINLQVS